MHLFEDFLGQKSSKRCNFRSRKSSKSLRDPISVKDLFIQALIVTVMVEEEESGLSTLNPTYHATEGFKLFVQSHTK